MSCSPRVSDLVANIRDRLKPAIHGGKFFHSEEVYALLQNLNTVHALAIELEDDKAILERNARLGTPIRIASDLLRERGGKVIAFPVKRPRLTVVSPDGGGDVA